MNIEFVFVLLLATLGVVGGIPQMLSWIKPTPGLKISNATIAKIPNSDFKVQVHFEVCNQRKWWKRFNGASNVTGEYYIIDKDGVQCGFVTGQAISPYLVAGAKMKKDIEGYHSLLSQGNPYRVIFRVTCNEGETATKSIVYQAPD